MRKILLIFILFQFGFFPLYSLDEKLDTLLNDLIVANEIDRISILNEISQLYSQTSPELAYDYAEQAMKLAQKNKLQKEIAIAYRNLGSALEGMNQYKKAMETLQNGVTFAIENKFLEIQSEILIQQGIVSIHLAKYDNSLRYLQQALTIAEKNEFKELQATSINFIGNIHYYLGNFDKALDYYLTAEKMFRNQKDDMHVARAMNSIGSIYSIKKDYNMALKYALESLELIEGHEQGELYVSFLNNIGIIYKQLEDYEKAFEFYFRALEIKKEIGDKKSIATSYLNIANLYFHLEQSDEAKKILDTGFEYVKDIDTKRLYANYLKLYAYVYSSLKNYDYAFDYYQQYDVIRDSLYTEESSNRIAEMEVMYETAQKEHEILLLKKDKELQDVLRTVFIIGIIFLIVLAFFIYSRYRIKFKANLALRNEIQERIRVEKELEKAKNELEERVKERTADLAKAYNEIEKTQKEVLFTLGEVVETRSHEVSDHVKRVAEISMILAKKVGLTEEETKLLKLASPMHDVGKIGIPDSILHKPGKLTVQEFEMMKDHTKIGYHLLKSSQRKILQAAAIIALQHHEQWDGNGYPNGLKGEEIHIFSRITQLADIFDALLFKRTYKDKWNLDQILDFIREEKGKRLDPQLVDIFLEDIDEFAYISIENH